MTCKGPFKALKRDEIRLLAISPGTQTEPLSGSLQTHSLDSAKELYTAISYPWGPPEDPRMTCRIDGFEIELRQNAHQILTKLRHSTSTILVWIDVLCIYQRDKDEKRSQILLMYKIYKLAGCTAIWLGLSDATTEQVVEFANSLNAVKIIPEIRSEVKYGEIYTRGRGKSFILDTLSRHPRKSLLINACARLFRATWLSRVWIRQEAAIGANPYILWGAYQMTWTQVAMLAWVFKPALTFTWPDWFEPNYTEIEPAIYTILSVERCRQYDQGGE
jgi:hypothetical protein